MKNILAFIAIGAFLVGCNRVVTPALQLTSSSTPLAVGSTQTPKPTATEVFQQHISATATNIQLPYNLVSRSDYCQSPYAMLPLRDAENLSEDEITYKLVDIWLSRYKKPEAHPYCRVDGYSIEKVYDDPLVYSQPLEPKGDFMRVIVFSVKLIQVPNDWMSFSGKLDQSNWLHLSHVVAISKTDNGYKMDFAYP